MECVVLQQVKAPLQWQGNILMQLDVHTNHCFRKHLMNKIQWAGINFYFEDNQRVGKNYRAITAIEYIMERDKAKANVRTLLSAPRPVHIALTRLILETVETLLSQL